MNRTRSRTKHNKKQALTTKMCKRRRNEEKEGVVGLCICAGRREKESLEVEFVYNQREREK